MGATALRIIETEAPATPLPLLAATSSRAVASPSAEAALPALPAPSLALAPFVPKPNARNVMNGLDLLAALPDGSVATGFFDPQYRGVLDKLGYGNEGARQQGRVALSQMGEGVIREFLGGLNRVLKPSGHLFFWIDKFHLCEGLLPWLVGTRLQIVDLVVWDKTKIGMGYRTRRRSEYLMVLQKEPRRAKGIWTSHSIPDVWSERVAKGHPHAKPIGLQRALIAATTRPGEAIVDPAAGGYSVREACRLEGGRTFWGADLEDHGGAY